MPLQAPAATLVLLSKRSAARPDPQSWNRPLPWSPERREASLVVRGRVLEPLASTRTTPTEEHITGAGVLTWPPPQGPLRHPCLPVYFPLHLRRYSGTFGSSLENDTVFAPYLSWPSCPQTPRRDLPLFPGTSLSPSSFQICLWRLQGRQTWCSDTNMMSWEL